MKKNVPHIVFYTLISLAVCLFFGHILSLFTVPMKDASYDLSLSWEGEAMPSDWIYDQKGWSVFVQEQETITPLTADGLGGFSGLQKPGQTFYFSRTLTETLDSPTLRLLTDNQSLAVFLDGKLLYTDCPELDNRIGYLTLPMLDWVRTEPVVLSLPHDYQGKTLTIAQSSGAGEKQLPETTSVVYPCSVSLYCGYSYESGLISESFRTAIPAALCFGVGVMLLGTFLWQLFSGSMDLTLLFLALTAFLYSAWKISLSSFFYTYFGKLSFDMTGCSRLLSLSTLLIFLTSRLTGKRRLIFGILTALQTLSVILCTVLGIPEQEYIWSSMSEYLGLAALSGICLCMGWEWKKGGFFPRIFLSLVLIELSVFLASLFFLPALRQDFIQQFFLASQGYFLWKLTRLTFLPSILATFMEIISKEIGRRTEQKILQEQYRLAQSGFENLRRHQEEIMMIRHDINKHLTFLRNAASEETIVLYLDELLGQQQTIPKTVQSRNPSMDLILNAKLAEAAEKGIFVEVIRADIPGSLPLSDVELCALFMNLLDNAIHAASACRRPRIQLDMHQKDGFFVFVCENTMKTSKRTAKKETVANHGLGLKIIKQIMKRYGDLIEIKQLSHAYRVTVAIPPDQPLK